EVGRSRLDHDALALEVDLEDAVHAGERDHDATRDRRRAAGEPGPGAACDEGNPLAMAGPDHRLDLLRRAGEDDELRHGAVAGQPVALVHAKLLGLDDHVAAAQRLPQFVPEAVRETHARPPTSRRAAIRNSGSRLANNRGPAPAPARRSRAPPTPARNGRAWISVARGC